MNKIFNRKRFARVSSDRLMVIADVGDIVEVRTYNFYKKKWGEGIRTMKLEHLLKNYEAETMQ